jgi:hypothetical protein
MTRAPVPHLALAGLTAVTILTCCAAARPEGPIADLQTLPTPALPGSAEPCLAVASDGGVFMSWIEKQDSTRHALRVSRFVRGTWSEARTVAEGDSFFVNWADFPALAALGGDKLVVAWPWKSGGETYAYHVRMSGSNDGGRTWTPPIVPHRDHTQTEHGFVSLVPAKEGGVRAFWLDGRKFADRKIADASGEGGLDAEMTLRTAWVGMDGVLQDEVEVDDRVCDCCQTGAVGHGSRAIVAYRDRSTDEVRDISVAWLAGGRWSEPAPVHHDGWRTPGCPVNGPALDAAGERVAVAWYTQVADSARVLVAFSTNGGRHFDEPVRVDQGNPLGRTDLVLLDDGALVSWLEVQGKEALVQVRRVDSRGGALSEPFTVARTSAARGSGFPRMVRSGRQVLFAWTQPGDPSRVRVALGRIP